MIGLIEPGEYEAWKARDPVECDEIMAQCTKPVSYNGYLMFMFTTQIDDDSVPIPIMTWPDLACAHMDFPFLPWNWLIGATK
jgi:hypothetical protein